jgi:hemoglobin
MQPAAFEQLGGFAKVRLIVSDFYDRVLDSDSLAPYFDGIDMRRLIDHQTKFISSILGGPASFSDEHLERAHRQLRIQPEDFDEVGLLLEDTLEDAGVDRATIDRVLGQVVAVRHRIVHAGTAVPAGRTA